MQNAWGFIAQTIAPRAKEGGRKVEAKTRHRKETHVKQASDGRRPWTTHGAITQCTKMYI